MRFRDLLYKREIDEKIGCHKLLDDGFISVQVVDSVVPGELDPKIREEALQVRMSNLDTNFGAATVRHVRLRKLNERVSDSAKGPDYRCRAYCELISTARRLASPRMMTCASKAVNEALPYICCSGVKHETQSWFYYEYALTLMQRHPDPDIKAAIECLEISVERAQKDELRAMSQIELLHARMLAASPDSDEISATWERQQNNAFKILESDDNKRWAISKGLHLSQKKLKTREDPGAVLSEVERIRKVRDSLTLATGWDRFQGVELLAANGMAHAQCGGDMTKALIALTRATMTMKQGCRGKRPEGYKDVAMCIAWALHKTKGHKQRSQEVQKIADQMIDGRSGVWTSV